MKKAQYIAIVDGRYAGSYDTSREAIEYAELMACADDMDCEYSVYRYEHGI